MSGAAMTHYIALLEEEEGKAVGVWFPDLPGCFQLAKRSTKPC